MKVVLDSPDGKRHRREIAQAVNILDSGKYGTVTLTANESTTTITDARIASTSPVILTPTTANAATAIATGAAYYLNTGRVNGSLTIQHANNAQTDRTFYYVILGN